MTQGNANNRTPPDMSTSLNTDHRNVHVRMNLSVQLFDSLKIVLMKPELCIVDALESFSVNAKPKGVGPDVEEVLLRSS